MSFSKDLPGNPVSFAASSVELVSADDDLSFRAQCSRWDIWLKEALGEACWPVADGADRHHRMHFVGDCHEGRHGAERLTLVVHVEPADDDAAASLTVPSNELHDFWAEKLALIDDDPFGVCGDELIHLGDGAHREPREPGSAVARKIRGVVALIDGVLEGDHVLFCDLCEMAEPNGFVAFTTEHGADDDDKPSDVTEAET